MSTAAQRKAWNDAMRSAGAVLPTSSSARTAASAAIDRRRKQRRDGARKSTTSFHGYSVGGVGGGDATTSSIEEMEYRMALRMDVLEGIVDDGTTINLDVDDEEYDEFAELDDDDENDDDDSDGSGGNRGRKGKPKKKRKRKGTTSFSGKKSSSSTLPKYLKPRSLASVLMEEASRSDSVARQYVNASERRNSSGQSTVMSPDSSNAIIKTTTKLYPARKFCPVTGLLGVYTEPKSGIPYASLTALEQIKERPPPWMNFSNTTGSASYWEAVKSLKNNYG